MISLPLKRLRLGKNLEKSASLGKNRPMKDCDFCIPVRDFQIKKYPKFSCGMGVPTRPLYSGRAGCPPHKKDNLFVGNPLTSGAIFPSRSWVLNPLTCNEASQFFSPSMKRCTHKSSNDSKFLLYAHGTSPCPAGHPSP